MTARSELVALAEAHQRARGDETETRAALYAAIREAVEGGMSEVQAARIAGVDRMTVRRILGKR